MDISLVTVTWSNEDDFNIKKTFVYQSFKKFNPDKKVFHFHFNRGHFWREEGYFHKTYGPESEYVLYKILMLLEKLRDLETDYVIFCDANDVTCLSSVDHLPDIFDLDNYIIVGCEKNQWPAIEKKSDWPRYEDYDEHDSKNESFLNSGMILAKKDKFVEMLSSLVHNVLPTRLETFGNDQGAYTYYYNKKVKPEIKLDYSGVFALNTFLRSTDDFYRNESRLVSKRNGIKPCFIHDNGWNYGSPKYHNYFELKDLYSENYLHLKKISREKPIPSSHQEYLFKLRDVVGFNPNVIYDIGACVLHWTTICKEVWPVSQYFLFEAMEEAEEIIMESGYQYHIGVLSDSVDKEVTFYKNVTFPGGNSYYLENPAHSPMAQTLFHNPSNAFLRKTETLDHVVKKRGFLLPDLIKIDVQGCEIDILRGATEVLKNTKHLIVELQHMDYNIGAKLEAESIPIIESMGFELVTPKFSLSSQADADYHFRRIQDVVTEHSDTPSS